MKRALVSLASGAALCATLTVGAVAPLKVMLIDGDNNHRSWPEISKILKKDRAHENKVD